MEDLRLVYTEIVRSARPIELQTCCADTARDATGSGWTQVACCIDRCTTVYAKVEW